VAVDSSANIYVANSAPSVTVYAGGSNGNVKPIQRIIGGKLTNPNSITVR
jgi:hypothetical protein